MANLLSRVQRIASRVSADVEITGLLGWIYDRAILRVDLEVVIRVSRVSDIVERESPIRRRVRSIVREGGSLETAGEKHE